MNQIAASILILASSVFGYGAITSTQEATTLLGAAALASGLCGVISLAAGFLPHQRDLSWYNSLDLGDSWSGRATSRSSLRDDGLTVQLPPDLKNDLNYVANLRGQDREQLVHDLLRRNLNGVKSRVA